MRKKGEMKLDNKYTFIIGECDWDFHERAKSIIKNKIKPEYFDEKFGYSRGFIKDDIKALLHYDEYFNSLMIQVDKNTLPKQLDQVRKWVKIIKDELGIKDEKYGYIFSISNKKNDKDFRYVLKL